MQNQRMPKQSATTKMEGRRKRGGPLERWEDNVEEDLNIMGIKINGRKWPETVGNGRRLCGKPRSTMDCNASTRKKRRVKSGGAAQ